MIAILHIAVIWLLAGILLLFTRNFLSVFKRHVIGRIIHPTDYRRIDTLSGVFRHAAAFVIFGMAIMLSLSEIGISVAPVLATAGVAGIAVGFGAQSLVKDFFSGLFLLIENQASEGEVIEAAGRTGQVEEITLRHIRMRDDDGSVHFIPNGIITTVTNKSREYGFAVVDLSVPRHLDLEQVFKIMREAGNDMRKDPIFGTYIIADIDIQGVEKIEDASMIIRCRLKSTPLRQSDVRREFLKRMKYALDMLSGKPPATERTGKN
jgi:small conductance mechanosensitive channel